ncbi:poly-gamma-glutamate hydrolase family protein [Priestia endophytica]|uniref:poly-gamma-glutamate hydrolase family protein n=1 Tax=Priestia endophytica TaxID=135735 RepID=UPI000DCA48C8|nr:poly-gamma-glutamate hydrolase family protein [Priestia endophytica]RAS84837.1 replication protein [Priestia endophytica]
MLIVLIVNLFVSLFHPIELDSGTKAISQDSEGYESYEQLKEVEKEGVDYRIRYENRDTSIAVFAIHGGRIEIGTSEVAEGLASRGDYSYYMFEGIKSQDNGILHITSVKFDEPIARTLARHSQTMISLHGFSSEERVIYVGGRNELYKYEIKKALTKYGFRTEEPREDLRGEELKNIVNDTILKQGVQLEISSSIRRSFFENNDWSRGNIENKSTVYYRFIDALEEASSKYKKNL